MDQHGVSKLQINSSQALSGVVALCLPLVMGWLSDPLGRKWILAGCYLLSGAGLVVLAFSMSLRQFYMFTASGVSRSPAPRHFCYCLSRRTLN
jgi:MFS family permease